MINKILNFFLSYSKFFSFVFNNLVNLLYLYVDWKISNVGYIVRLFAQTMKSIIREIRVHDPYSYVKLGREPGTQWPISYLSPRDLWSKIKLIDLRETVRTFGREMNHPKREETKLKAQHSNTHMKKNIDEEEEKET